MEGWSTHADELLSPDAHVSEKLTDHVSKARAKASAKQSLAEGRSRSANSLHLMAKFMSDIDNKCLARLIAYVLQTESAAAGRMFQELRGPDRTLEYYCHWAHWGWMEVAIDTVAVLSNLELLGRLGFNMSGEKPDPAGCAAEDALAKLMFRLLCSLLKYRSGSQLWYTCGAGAMAGLVHSDSGKVKASLQFFEAAYQTLDPCQRK